MKKVSETDFSGIQSGFRVSSEMAHGGQTWSTDDAAVTIMHIWKQYPESSSVTVNMNGEYYRTVGKIWNVDRTPILHALWTSEKWENVDDAYVAQELSRAIASGELV